MRSDRVVVIGAGVGGLSSAIALAARGVEVTLLERAAAPGGKMREVHVGDSAIDAGPTVLTLRWVFEELFDQAGTSFAREVATVPAEVLARHAWGCDQRLDLFADAGRSVEAVAALMGTAEGRRLDAFLREARLIYVTLRDSFIRAQRTSALGLARRAGLRGMSDLWRIRPFDSMWQALGTRFGDPRLRQLFGRYATYCGSSPMAAPATLMLVAHVECEGVWLVEGGMHRLAQALATVARRLGVAIRYATEAARIEVERGRAVGVRSARGERFGADAVVVNADSAAVAAGLFGDDARRAVRPFPAASRSLSAVTWNMVARTRGFPLSRHNVFFSDDYPGEFRNLFEQRRLPADPTVYVCAQDRGARVGAPGEDDDGDRHDRLLVLVNAPATGDMSQPTCEEIDRCEQRTFARLSQCGLQLEPLTDSSVRTTPSDFERLFPATGGALYGRATHGWNATFQRPGARSPIAGLYLAGGSTHPGPGVPMAALAGRAAAQALLEDLASSGRSFPVAMRGGTSTG